MYPLIGRHGGGGGRGGGGGGAWRGAAGPGGRGAWRGQRRPGIRRRQYGGGWYGWWPYWPYQVDPYGYDEYEYAYAAEPDFAGEIAQGDVAVGAARAMTSPDNDLVSVLPAIGPGSGISCQIDLDPASHVLYVTVQIDGRAYQTCADLSGDLAEVAHGVSYEHEAAHAANGVAAPPAGASPAAVSALDQRAEQVVKSAGVALVGALYDQHANFISGGWFDSVTDAVSWISSPVTKVTAMVTKPVAKTLRQFKGPISVAAGALATAYGGPLAGAAASQLTGPMLDSLAETGGDPTEFIRGIGKASGGDPQVKQALDVAQRAASHATAAYHVTATAADAAGGDQDSARKIAEIDALAGSGDLAAQQAMQIIAEVFSALGSRSATMSGKVTYPQRGDVRTTVPPAPRARPTARELRREAQDAVREARDQHGARVIGFARYDDGGTTVGPNGNMVVRQQTVVVMPFSDPDEADDWFGQLAIGDIVYAAYYDARDPTWPRPLNEKFGRGGSSDHYLPSALARGGSADQIVRQFAAELQQVAREQGSALSDSPVAVQGVPWLPLLAAAAAGGGAGWLGHDWWAHRRAAAQAAAAQAAAMQAAAATAAQPPTTSSGIGILPWLAVAAAGGAGWYGHRWWAERSAKAAAEAAAAQAVVPPPSPQEVPQAAAVAASGWW